MRHGHYTRIGTAYVAGAYVRHARAYRASEHRFAKTESLEAYYLRLEYELQ